MDVNLRPGRKIKRPFEEKCAAGFIPGAVLLGLFLVWFLEFRDWNLMDSFVGSLVEIGCFVLCGLILCGWWIFYEHYIGAIASAIMVLIHRSKISWHPKLRK